MFENELDLLEENAFWFGSEDLKQAVEKIKKYINWSCQKSGEAPETTPQKEKSKNPTKKCPKCGEVAFLSERTGKYNCRFDLSCGWSGK
jgi:ribosomal protein S27AE